MTPKCCLASQEKLVTRLLPSQAWCWLRSLGLWGKWKKSCMGFQVPSGALQSGAVSRDSTEATAGRPSQDCGEDVGGGGVAPSMASLRITADPSGARCGCHE